ncbi:ATP-binding protein [Shewanella sp. SNU WT4]|uniref:ATP-binding protein n=1 Tax=Shewanella sp. SNU WT4 TaxID=2590015 RepID=UPI00143D6F72|nr:ATP-binding protein [Shewanella sp. SNU WT4]
MSFRSQLLLGMGLLLLVPIGWLWLQFQHQAQTGHTQHQALIDYRAQDVGDALGKQLIAWQQQAILATTAFDELKFAEDISDSDKLGQLAQLFPEFDFIGLYDTAHQLVTHHANAQLLDDPSVHASVLPASLSLSAAKVNQIYAEVWQQNPRITHSAPSLYALVVNDKAWQQLAFITKAKVGGHYLLWLIDAERLLSFLKVQQQQDKKAFGWQSLLLSDDKGLLQWRIDYAARESSTPSEGGKLNSPTVAFYPSLQPLHPWHLQLAMTPLQASPELLQQDWFWRSLQLLILLLVLTAAWFIYITRGLNRLLQLSHYVIEQSGSANAAPQSMNLKLPRAVTAAWQPLLELLKQYQTMQQDYLKLQDANRYLRQDLQLKDGAMATSTISLAILDTAEFHFPVVYANQTYSQGHDNAVGTIIGQTCRYLDSEFTPASTVTTLTQAIANSECADVLLKDATNPNNPSWLHVHFAPINTSEHLKRYYVAVGTDITQLKAYEKRVRDLNMSLEQKVNVRTLALQQAEHQLRATLDTMSDALLVVDPDGTIKEVNRTAINLFGFRAEEIFGQNLALVMADCDHIPNIDAWFTSLLVGTTKKMRSQVETLAINKSGALFAVEVSVTCVRSKYQQTYTMVLRDISDRKAAEVRLRNAKDEAELANRTKSEFLANMSHELRTPMNAVIGMTEIVLDTELTREQRRHLTTVSKSAHSLLGLLNDILDLTKLERGSVELERLAFDIRRTLGSVINLMELQALKNGLKISYQVAANVPNLVVSDPAKLRQVLINLIGNAIKFTEKGEIKVSAYLTDSSQGGLVNFVVADTGIGISNDRLEHIFKPFVQSDGSISRRYGGTGLGTTISRELVEKMGGQMWVESELGVGSRFYFTIYAPAAKDQTKVQFQEENPLTCYRLLEPLKILLAEDVAVNAELIQTRLGREKHQIDWAKDGLEAVELFELAEGQYDLVLMDIHMPNMNGFEAHKRIKEYAAKQGRPVPVIALTASGMRRDVDQCLDEGMDGFVIKPVDFAHLNSEMAKLVPLHFELSSADSVLTPAQEALEQHDRFVNVRHCIQVDKALHNWGDESLYLKMLREFPSHWQSLVTEINQCLEKNEYQRAKGATHKLKGVAGGLGMANLYDATRLLDDALSDSAPGAKLLGLLSELEDALFAVTSAINKLPLEPQKNLTLDSNIELIEIDELLARLLIFREKLERGMLDDAELECLSQQLLGYGLTELAGLLVELTEDFDFTGAIGVIDQSAEQLNQQMEQSHG